MAINSANSASLRLALRQKITEAYRKAESLCLSTLIDEATLDLHIKKNAREFAYQLVETLRAKGYKKGVENLIHEFSLSSDEGIALMCLAEALLRIPDTDTRDALIKDKISHGQWQQHLGHSPSLFVNATTWGLLITGKLLSASSETGLTSALSRLVMKGGEPLIRKGVDIAMKMMGEQFVCGRTIEEALKHSQSREAQGFRYSYDMLGEAALTQEDALRYYASYETAIHAIGKASAASANQGIYKGPGISIKLSALHPRYSRAQQQRVMQELLPRVKSLVLLAYRYNIGINIDAEEADRLELSLDVLEALCFDTQLADWHGIGFVVQAYQKRAPFVIDYLIDLAQRSHHRLMIRLVKGAYWDSEIKRAQIDGHEDYPVYTRKQHTDIAYIACAKKMLSASSNIYAQFATHNALTLATIYSLACTYTAIENQYEFQCLHGMGETLYKTVLDHLQSNSAQPFKPSCRIYAPVGTHETLLAYLVRRLLENGANTSFVHQLADKNISIEDLLHDPIDQIKNTLPIGAPHPHIPLPTKLYGNERNNSYGLDLSNEIVLTTLFTALDKHATQQWQAQALLGHVLGHALEKKSDQYKNSCAPSQQSKRYAIHNPANTQDIVGQVIEADFNDIETALTCALEAAPSWAQTPPTRRAEYLMYAADLLEAQRFTFMSVLIREAGKTIANAVGEIREAIDFLRYYAIQIRQSTQHNCPLGVVVSISPWNFPLAIFIGQISAALAAGNTVIAKPAEQTPLIGAMAIQLLRDAGIPSSVIQFLPGDGETIGAALVADPRIQGVLFTGSTEVARLIAQSLSKRLNKDHQAIPLIAETGGQNAMIVDSSALPEQVVQDVLTSAFDSAGQRCSALRILCVQEEIADRVITMLKGSMQELTIGDPRLLSTDIGPVIDADSETKLHRYIQERMHHNTDRLIYQLPLPEHCSTGHFVSPTLIGINDVTELSGEVFGPVLHVLRYKRDQLEQLIEALNETGYGLTFGLHSRIDEMHQRVIKNIRAGNIYINRNIVGAVVGVQPFGGEGLSGTGPKAGGPLYIQRLQQAPKNTSYVSTLPRNFFEKNKNVNQPLHQTLKDYCHYLETIQPTHIIKACRDYEAHSLLGLTQVLPGPTGEHNEYRLKPRGTVLCIASSLQGIQLQIAAVLASGNQALLIRNEYIEDFFEQLPLTVKACVRISALTVEEIFQQHTQAQDMQAIAALLFEGPVAEFQKINQQAAQSEGRLIQSYGLDTNKIVEGELYPLMHLMIEQTISVNTAAAGGNTSLLLI